MSHGNIRKTIFSRNRLPFEADPAALPDRAAATLAIRQGVFIGQRSGAVPDADAEGTGIDPATGTSCPCEN